MSHRSQTNQQKIPPSDLRIDPHTFFFVTFRLLLFFYLATAKQKEHNIIMPAAPTSRVDAQLIQKAVEALLKHHQKTSNDKALLGDDSLIQVTFGLDKVPNQSSAKPKRVDIPHALWKTSGDDDADGNQEPTVCLIVKEESKEWVQELITAFPKEMGLVKKVLGLDSLRKKHAKFEQQRALLHRFDVFMADDRILPMLAKSLGKHFFATKKQPIPVRLTRKTALPLVILQSLRSTFWYLSEGTCLTVKAGTTGMSAKHITENIAAICAHVPTKVPRQWANVRSIALKTTNSVALPLYNKTPAEITEIARLAGIEDEKVIEEQPDADEKNDEQARKKRKAAKSPLVKALKRQQAEEAAEEKSKKEEEPMQKKKRKGSADIDEDVTKSPEKKLRKTVETPKAKSLKRGADDGSSSKKIETPKSKSPGKELKKSKPNEETPKSKSPGKSVDAGSSSKKKSVTKPKEETPKSKKTTPKKEETPKSKKATPKKEETPKSKKATPKKDEASKSFISAKKHTGSKSGFVFKLGTKGLGYYVDVKPVVDPMVLAALRRSGQQNGGGSGRKQQKGKGRGRR